MGKPVDIKANIYRMMTSSCSCVTKTNDPDYHYVDCRYRQLNEALSYIEELENKVEYLKELYEGTSQDETAQ